jgi:hypothetical protein
LGSLQTHATDFGPGRIAARDPGFDWNDFLAGSKLAASYEGKLSGIPYRITTGILVYQKALVLKTLLFLCRERVSRG